MARQSKSIFKRFHGDLELEVMDFGCLLHKSKSGFLNLKKPLNEWPIVVKTRENVLVL